MKKVIVSNYDDIFYRNDDDIKKLTSTKKNYEKREYFYLSNR